MLALLKYPPDQFLPKCVFTESAPRPIQSIGCDVCCWLDILHPHSVYLAHQNILDKVVKFIPKPIHCWHQPVMMISLPLPICGGLGTKGRLTVKRWLLEVIASCFFLPVIFHGFRNLHILNKFCPIFIPVRSIPLQLYVICCTKSTHLKVAFWVPHSFNPITKAPYIVILFFLHQYGCHIFHGWPYLVNGEVSFNWLTKDVVATALLEHRLDKYIQREGGNL